MATQQQQRLWSTMECSQPTTWTMNRNLLMTSCAKAFPGRLTNSDSTLSRAAHLHRGVISLSLCTLEVLRHLPIHNHPLALSRMHTIHNLHPSPHTQTTTVHRQKSLQAFNVKKATNGNGGNHTNSPLLHLMSKKAGMQKGELHKFPVHKTELQLATLYTCWQGKRREEQCCLPCKQGQNVIIVAKHDVSKIKTSIHYHDNNISENSQLR